MTEKIDVKEFVNNYIFETKLPGSGETVSFKPITTGQMKTLLTYENEDSWIRQEEALDDLISSSVVSEGFDINELYLQDRFFLLLEIRKKSKGNMYNFTFKCPKCEMENFSGVDLDKLEVKELNREKIKSEVKLNDSLTAELDHLKRKENKQALEIVENLKENFSESQKRAEFSLYLQALAIKKFKTPQGETTDTPLEDKYFVVNNLNQSAYERLSNWFTENNFGVDFTFPLKCVKCGHEEKYSIPLTNFFA